MKIIDLKTGKETTLSEYERVSCALGNFDGVHLGHRALLRIAAEKKNADRSAVWTFSEPSSRTMNGIALLTDPEERLMIFRELGIDLAFLADFASVRGLDKETFAREILYKECHVRRAVCGFNFRYGMKASGNAECLKRSFSELGADVEIVPPFTLDGMTVSSSEIRGALARGEMERVTEMLARPYSVTSVVSHGKKLGRTLGFPTANQSIPPLRAVPAFGVYAVRMTVDGNIYHGVANVGVRPTVENTDAVNCETYLLDFEGDLYGKTVKTEFLHFLRGERCFSDVSELKAAVDQNILEAKAYFEGQKETKK
jgi:riboflavin kinase/FMN adenylyltransferase